MAGEVDFYVRSDSGSDAIERFACRLVEKIWQRGRGVLVLTPSDAAARQFDDLLWTFRDDSFVPHRRFGAGDPPTSAPEVAISTPGVWSGELDVLLNLTPTVPEEAARAARIAEIVADNGAERDAGRQRFREYRDRGFEIKTHR